MSERVILKTPRLSFVMRDEGDAPLVQQLHSTMATTRYLPGKAPWSHEKAEERLRGWFEEQARDSTTKYKLLAEDGSFIGRAGISRFRSEQFELGYSLREAAWARAWRPRLQARWPAGSSNGSLQQVSSPSPILKTSPRSASSRKSACANARGS
ncbi:hypothetical protein FHX03_006255 [Rhizobium sp. BK456]|nr:hypothetical protein [Rhizobium sp. BK456]